MSIEATITQYEDVRTLSLSGPLRFADRRDLLRVCECACDMPEPHLLVDLTQVEAMERCCIRVLEDLATDTIEAGAEVAFVVPDRTRRLMLSTYGLRARIHVVDSGEDGDRILHAQRDADEVAPLSRIH